MDKTPETIRDELFDLLLELEDGGNSEKRVNLHSACVKVEKLVEMLLREVESTKSV